MATMTRKYGAKAADKIGRTLHEFKRGKLKSGSGGKVTSRQQAVAIGISQARRAGYKVPPQHGLASISLDTQVRWYLSNMQPGTEVDARGIARALGGIDPLAADYALERAEKAGLASTSDGRWFGPKAPVHHATKKKTTTAQLKREIADALAKAPPGDNGWGGMCLTGRHGLDFEGQDCDVCTHERGGPCQRNCRKCYAERARKLTTETVTAPRRRAHAKRKARPPRVTPYRINLTPDELRAAEFASGRYAWPDMLSAHAAENGLVSFTESEMWQWADDVDSDTEGGHSPFPLASGVLAEKLQRFYDARV